MKKIISLVLIVLTLSVTTVYAAEIPEERQLPRVVDRADILSSYEEAALTSLCDEISEEVQCDVAVVTVQSLGGKSAQAYADDFYDYNGYGMGYGDDEILLLLAMDEREWAFTTYGLAIRAIPNYAIDEIAEEIVPSLSSGDYYDAFARYVSLAEDYVSHYRANGSVLGFGGYSDYEGDGFYRDDDFYYDDEFYYSGDSSLTTSEKLGVSAVVAAIVALIIMMSIKSGMKTIRANNFATPYMVQGSLKLRESRDMFLYRNVTRTRRQTESSHHGGSRGGRMGGGGGSTHRSSSGRSHGGRSGRF